MSGARWLLPAGAYWSPEWFAREQERLFGRCWNLVGTVEDLAGGRSLVARIGSRQVIVDEGPGRAVRARRIADPVLDLDGGPAAVAEWSGLLFAHLDPEPDPPLTAWLGTFPDKIGGFRPDRLTEVARYRFELAANWKFFVENHVDVYHLWYLHAGSLGEYDHHAARWEMCGPHWVFYEPPARGVDVDGESFWRGLRPVGHVERDRWGSGAHLVFPNLTLATGAGFFMTYQCIPIAPDRSVVDLRVRAEPGSDPTAMLAMSRRIIEEEDAAACAAMQAAVRSRAFAVGPLAREHELPITRFQENVLAVMA